MGSLRGSIRTTLQRERAQSYSVGWSRVNGDPFSTPSLRRLELAPSWWTPGLSCQPLIVASFKFDWAEIAEGRMAPPAVIERLEVFKNSSAGLGTASPLNLINQFELETGEKTLGDRVVPAITASAHTATKAVFGE